MNDWEKELGVQMFVNNFKALQQHCEETFKRVAHYRILGQSDQGQGE